MITTLAGHNFSSFGGPCSCGISWFSIRSATLEDLGKPGIAHTGCLTQDEYNQIEAARAAEDARIEAATAELSGRTR